MINLATKNSKSPDPAKALKKKIADGEKEIKQLEKDLKKKQKEVEKDKSSREGTIRLFRNELYKDVQKLLELIRTDREGPVAKAVEGVILRENHWIPVGWGCNDSKRSRDLYEYAKAFGNIEYDENRSRYENHRGDREATLECWDKEKRDEHEKIIAGKGIIICAPDMTEKNFESLAIALAFYYYRNGENIKKAIQKTKALFEKERTKFNLYDEALFEYLYDHS